ncbi:MAG: hypothetical protein Q9213_002205 [Squamulea squamosa]
MMLFFINLLPFFSLLFFPLCIGSTITAKADAGTIDVVSNHSGRHIHVSFQRRDDNDNIWHLVHFGPFTAIYPLDIGATTMSQFYHLVYQAAIGGWRLRPPSRFRIQMAWGRIAMIMIVQGIEYIPWELVAQYAEGMRNQVNNGHIAFTYDGYFLKENETPRAHGLYVGVRIMGQQEAVNNFLAAGRNGYLNPDHA